MRIIKVLDLAITRENQRKAKYEAKEKAFELNKRVTLVLSRENKYMIALDEKERTDDEKIKNSVVVIESFYPDEDTEFFYEPFKVMVACS